MKRQSLFFTAPSEIEIREITLQPPAPGELLVETQVSAISAGSELLIYRGQAPTEMAADDGISALSGSLAYPLQYGYAAVGLVTQIGESLSQEWVGRSVFSFQPHQTHFTATPEQIIPLPEGISSQAAVFLPNMETAVTLVMDGRPLIGERVAVFGQGIVGLLTTAVLAQFPLEEILTLDLLPNRRAASLDAGASRSFDPADTDTLEQVRGQKGLDLAYELSGSSSGLDQALTITGFAGRVVIGSWYGQKRANLDLGGAFHRSRIQLLSSQVSSLNPALTGRWDKARRFSLAWEMIRQIRPERWITQRVPFQKASQAYQLLDQSPGEAIQVLLDY